MDFSGRGSQPAQPASAPFNGAPTGGKKSKGGANKTKLTTWGTGVVGLLVLALVVALIVVIGTGGRGGEANRVDTTKLQAVFLQTGQVYFGKIDNKSFDGKSFVLNDIYYLQTSNTGTQQNANTNVSLVKLGCELHAPKDQMIVNRDQVTFWENLNDNGQVAKAVATFKKDNPNGQKCQDASTAPTNSNVQGSSNTNTGANSTTPTGSTSTNANN